MAKYHYYGVKGDYTWCLPSYYSPIQLSWYAPKIIEESDLAWCQGPRGGVRLVHQSWAQVVDFKFRKQGYITNNKTAMKEFAWVKLRARDLTVK